MRVAGPMTSNEVLGPLLSSEPINGVLEPLFARTSNIISWDTRVSMVAVMWAMWVFYRAAREILVQNLKHTKLLEVMSSELVTNSVKTETKCAEYYSMEFSQLKLLTTNSIFPRTFAGWVWTVFVRMINVALDTGVSGMGIQFRWRITWRFSQNFTWIDYKWFMIGEFDFLRQLFIYKIGS